MRLIDITGFCESLTEHETVSGILTKLSKQQTIDAVPVVRCKECWYYQNAKLNKKGFLICPASCTEITEDDYCSYGERKEDNA